MAIDTAEKRRSISGIWLLIPGVTPNAAKDQEWRHESAWGYSGILAGVAPSTQQFLIKADVTIVKTITGEVTI